MYFQERFTNTAHAKSLFGDESEQESISEKLLEPAQPWGCEWNKMARNKWDGPCFNSFDIRNLELNEDELNGKLSFRMVVCGLQNFTRLPDSRLYYYTKLVLQNLGITDISVLSYYEGLQYLDLSGNKITNIDALSGCKYLVHLDLNHNNISLIDHYEPPYFLTYLDLSNNDLGTIPDFSQFWALKHLNLSNNTFDYISGVSQLKYITYLDLSYNRIKVLEQINDLSSLKVLDLSYNCLEDLPADDNDERSRNTAEKIIVTNNNLTSLKFFKAMYPLKKMVADKNKIADLRELEFLKGFKNLIELDLRDNPVMQHPAARSYLIYVVPSLQLLDEVKVTSAEKVTANNLMNNSGLYAGAMNNHCTYMIKRHTAGPDKQGLDVRNKLFNPCIVILVGLHGSSRMILAESAAKEYPQYIKIVNMYSTHPVLIRADQERKYVITHQKFNNMLMDNEFILVQKAFGNLTGITYDELEYDGRVCLVAAPMDTALCALWMGLEPTLIFALPFNKETYYKSLLEVLKPKEPSEESWTTNKSTRNFLRFTQKNITESALRVGKRIITELKHQLAEEAIKMQTEKHEEHVPPAKKNQEPFECVICSQEEEVEEALSDLEYSELDESFIALDTKCSVHHMLELRERYIKFYKENVGMFVEWINGEFNSDSYRRLIDICHDVYKERNSKPRTLYKPQGPPYNDYLRGHINKCMEELHSGCIPSSAQKN